MIFMILFMMPNRKLKKAFYKTNVVKKDPRFVKTIGKLVASHLLESNTIKPFKGNVTLQEALWAGQFEPRILELLPAIVLKKKNLFQLKGPFPEDLADVVRRIIHGEEAVPFRGVEPRLYLKWVERVGHKGKSPALLKTFRFSNEYVKLLNELKSKTSLKEIEIIRDALSLFYKKVA